MRSSTVFLLVLALALAGIGWQPPDVDAVVVCQRKNKVRLRAESCKEKETQLFDSGEVGVERGRIDAHDGRLDEQQAGLDDHEARLDDHEARLGRTETALTLHCDGDVEREQVSNSAGLGGCRTLDEDQEACESAFQLGEGGPASCVFFEDHCVACEAFLHATGVCVNTCQPISCADPARTTGTVACTDAADQTACEQSWAASGSFATPGQVLKATTCFWTGLACDVCRADDISEGACQNTCLTPEQFPRCRASARTFGSCFSLDGNEDACNATYGLSGGGTEACWYNAGSCEPCSTLDQADGLCTNDC